MSRRAVTSLAAVSGIAVLAVAGLLLARASQRGDSLRSIRAAYEASDFPTAHRRALDHLKRWPDDTPALLLAARSLCRMNQVDRAAALYRRVDSPFELEDLRSMASALVDAGRQQEAIVWYRAVLDQAPDDVLALRRLAALEIAQDNVPVAFDLADHLTEIESGAVVGYTLKGVIAYNGGVPEESVSAFEQVLRLDPALCEMPLKPRQMFWGYLARDLLRLGRSAEARGYLQRALKDHPKDAGFMDLLAKCFEQEGKIEQAARCWRLSAEWDPGLASPWLNLGRLALLDGDPERAIPLLLEAVDRAPDAPEPYSNLSLAYRRLNQLDEAERYLEKADRLRSPQVDRAPVP